MNNDVMKAMHAKISMTHGIVYSFTEDKKKSRVSQRF